MMISAAVLGASGYAGGELIRFIDAHPSMDAVHLGAHTKAGERLGTVHPQLDGGDRVLGSLDPVDLPEVDVVFFALPHGASAGPAVQLLASGARLVDLGSDFRLDTPQRYLDAYGSDHPHPEQLGAWAYGIPELFAEDIRTAHAVAAPGCYPTSALLGLVPLVRDGLIESTGIIVDSLSGVSGAGRGVSESLQFGVIAESVKAYKVLEHRHRPEIERALDAAGNGPHQVVFTPHLVPIQRGILSTIYADTVDGATHADLIASVDEAYANNAFVRRIDVPPETRWVSGSNNALISVHLDERSRRVVVLVAIDNLVKGAAGQAIQCANLMLGLDETSGLPTTGSMP
jgi:N-acetyl-gamma-glutamyl-phosphate reductase